MSPHIYRAIDIETIVLISLALFDILLISHAAHLARLFLTS